MSSAYTYTATYGSNPSFLRSLLIRLENALVFMGFIVGLLLIFENFSKMLQGEGALEMEMLILSFVMWMGGYLTRGFFTKRWGGVDFAYDLKEKVRVELLYFLFSYTFVTLFITTFLRYVPKYYSSLNIKDATFLTAYFNSEFLMSVFLNLFVLLVFLLGLLSFTEFLYNSFFGSAKYTAQKANAYKTGKVFLIAFMLMGSFIVMQIPFVADTLDIIHTKTLDLFVKNLKWFFDYLLIFPIFYYLVASFKGSLLAEKFSVERKLI